MSYIDGWVGYFVLRCINPFELSNAELNFEQFSLVLVKFL